MDDDDLDMPPYANPQLRERRMDAATRRITVIAGGLGIGVILVAILWNGLDAGLGPPPVAKPPAGPMRSIPANRGGLQVPGANEPILSGAPPTKPQLAPAPPSPDLAPLEATNSPKARASSTASATLPALPLPALPLPALPLPALPLPPPREPTAALPNGGHPNVASPNVAPSSVLAPAALPAAKPVATGPASAQLAALPSQAGAMQAWQTLVARVPTLLGTLTPSIVPAQVHGQTYYQVRLNFASRPDAAAFCARLHTRSVPCYVPHQQK